MFLICETEKSKTKQLVIKKENSKSLAPFYSEYNLISKTINVTSSSLLVMFSCQISNPFGINMNLLFNIKRYSDDSSEQDIGSTYTFSSDAKNSCRTFSFQFLDEDLSLSKYTYAVSVSSNCFYTIPPGLIIPLCSLNFIEGN